MKAETPRMIKTEAVLIMPSGWISKHAFFVPNSCAERWDAMILQAQALMQSYDVIMTHAPHDPDLGWFDPGFWHVRGVMLPMFLDRALYARDLKNSDPLGRLFNAKATKLCHAPPSDLAEVPRPVLGPALVYGPESIKGCDKYFRPIKHPSVSKSSPSECEKEQ